jgi:hypothetical protein
MLRVAYDQSRKELLVDGSRADYEHLRDAVRQSIVSGSELELPVQSAGQTTITHLVVRRGTPPNRVSHERGRIILEVASSLEEEFLSFVDFPADADLSKSSTRYHHHFDGLSDDGTYVALDSLPVVFGLGPV